MTATRERSTPEQARAEATPGLGDASLAESLSVLVAGIVPALARGLFSPRRSAMKLLTRLNSDGRAIAALSKLRAKHNGEGLKLLSGRLVVLWGEAAIRDVLDNSADVYAGNAGAKAKGMAHFQPDALTLSYGEEWQDRRAFNEAVLAARERLHPMAERFVAVVSDEVGRLELPGRLEWREWEKLFDHITLRVIFGDRARDDQELTARLERLMGEANRFVGLKPDDDYYEFYGALERYLREPDPESLIAQITRAPQSDETRVVHQLPHWMFAMRDTLAANVYRALAVIASDPTICRRVRDEIDAVDVSDPTDVDRLSYLEGCLQEAMRLWPTTPLLARQTTREVKLAGEDVDEGTQVVMLNVFNHRDPDHVENADRMLPERWSGSGRDYRFNHLSNGRQDCPGAPLVLLLGKAAIANTLACYTLTLEHPRLPADEPLPHMLDFFETRFRVSPR